MRRASLLLAALTLSTPVIIGIAATPAAAASGSLVITTIGREGTKVTTTIAVSNSVLTTPYTATSGKKLTLPDGTYDLMTDIYNAADGTDTIGGKIVTVSGATTTTIDARGGKPVSISLDKAPGPDYTPTYWVNLCNGVNNYEAFSTPGKLYVIPNTSKTLTFAYLSIWKSPSTPTNSYVATAETTGIPSGLNTVVKTASLSNITLTARGGPEVAPEADFSLTPMKQFDNGGDCRSDIYTEVYDASVPWKVTAHVTPGDWLIRSDEYSPHGIETWDVGGWFHYEHLTTGESFPWTFYRSGWGPSVSLPETDAKYLNFDTSKMFGDPELSDIGQDAREKTSSTLSLGSTVLNTTTGDVHKKLSKAGWYTLTTTAARYDPDITFVPNLLSPKSAVTFHFYDSLATGVAPVYLTRFEPLALSWTNRATLGSTTDVELKLDRSSGTPGIKLPSVTVKTITAQASYDSGKTWHSVTVTHSGTSWSAAVPNTVAGTVSLRDTVTDTKGNSSTVTVYSAYSIS